MKKVPICQHFFIDYYSATPKYLQLANSISKAVAEGRVKKGELLPSINEMSFEFECSRDTIEKAYKHLKSLGVLKSVPGKGYFVHDMHVTQSVKVLLLFNKLSAHKKIIYDAFIKTLSNATVVDFFIYNSEFALLKQIISERKDNYTHCVILPHFREHWDRVHEIINTIPKEKLILLDKNLPGITGDYGAVYENFEKDIYTSLEQALDKLQKYQTLKIIFPENSYYPDEIKKGLVQFCQDYAFPCKVVHDIAAEPIDEGDVYIVIREDDLVIALERIMASDLLVGENVGIISYNETPLKKFILNGLTTISTDFYRMGELAAQMIIDNTRRHEEVPFYITMRASI